MVDKYDIDIKFVSSEHWQKFLYQLEPVTTFFQSVVFEICEFFQEIGNHIWKGHAFGRLFPWPFALQYIKVSRYFQIFDVLGGDCNLWLFFGDGDFEVFQEGKVLKVEEVQ